jgi:hypothetical protein
LACLASACGENVACWKPPPCSTPFWPGDNLWVRMIRLARDGYRSTKSQAVRFSIT